MIDPKSSETDLKERITKLEAENRCLRDYVGAGFNRSDDGQLSRDGLIIAYQGRSSPDFTIELLWPGLADGIGSREVKGLVEIIHLAKEGKQDFQDFLASALNAGVESYDVVNWHRKSGQGKHLVGMVSKGDDKSIGAPLDLPDGTDKDVFLTRDPNAQTPFFAHSQLGNRKGYLYVTKNCKPDEKSLASPHYSVLEWLRMDFTVAGAEIQTIREGITTGGRALYDRSGDLVASLAFVFGYAARHWQQRLQEPSLVVDSDENVLNLQKEYKLGNHPELVRRLRTVAQSDPSAVLTTYLSK